jgi:RNA recognition motif-containing protein
MDFMSSAKIWIDVNKQVGTPRGSLRKPLANRNTDESIYHDRQLHFANLSDDTTFEDIEQLLMDVHSSIIGINFVADPLTGQNPSCFFVEYFSTEATETVIEVYHGRVFLGRPLQVNRAVRPGTGTGTWRPGFRAEDNSDMSSAREAPTDGWRALRTPAPRGDPTREGRRLHVSGLPKFGTPYLTYRTIRELFRSHDIDFETIGKMIPGHEDIQQQTENHYYCFIIFASSDIADKAIAALDGMEIWGWKLKLNKAREGAPEGLPERKRLYVGGLPHFDGREALKQGIKELFEGFDDVQLATNLYYRANANFCFVDLASEEQAEVAIEELDWKEMWDRYVRVAFAFAKGATRSQRRGGGARR